MDAAQPPPLRSQWSSIVKQPQSKGKEGPVPAFSAQAMKQDTPGSPAAGTANTGTSAPPHPRLSTAHQKLASFGNGKQSSPKTADKDLNIANGFASPSSTALSPGTPPLEAPSTKPQSPEKQSQPSSGASQSAAQTQVCTISRLSHLLHKCRRPNQLLHPWSRSGLTTFSVVCAAKKRGHT